MAASPHPTPVPSRSRIQQLWTQSIAVRPRGLALAREKGWVLAWDEQDWLYLFTAAGERQGQARAPGPLAAACAAEDGSHYAAVGKAGEVWWLAPDLMPRWERSMPRPAVAVAMDSFGQCVAVCDAQGNVQVFDRSGQPVCQLQSARPLHHLAFVPSRPMIVGSADFGLAAGFDFQGRWLWREGLVAHVGSLAVSGTGSRVVLACFTEGLLSYALDGRKQGRIAVPEPCRLVALTYDARLVLAAGLSDRLRLLDPDGRVLHTHRLAKPAIALAVGPLGETAVVALAEGGLIGLDLREVARS
jgi:hypothetical protein